jgi:hypothetical protein
MGYRFHLSCWNGDLTKVEWEARVAATEATFLVVLNLDASVDAVNEFKQFLKTITAETVGWVPITSSTWLITAPGVQLEQMFKICVDSFPVQRHSFTVVELATGEGLAFDPKERIVYEVYPPGKLKE